MRRQRTGSLGFFDASFAFDALRLYFEPLTSAPGAIRRIVATLRDERPRTLAARGERYSSARIETCSMSGEGMDRLALALMNRGFVRGERENIGGELADYVAAVELPLTSISVRAQALVCCGMARQKLRYLNEAAADFTAAIELLPPTYARLRMEALVRRGSIRGTLRDIDGALADYGAAIAQSPDRDDRLLAALFPKGVAKYECGDIEGAIDFYAVVATLPGPWRLVLQSARETLMGARRIGPTGGYASRRSTDTSRSTQLPKRHARTV